MRKLMSMLLILFISLSLSAQTYQTYQHIELGEDLTKAQANLILDMSKLISYDIGFSSTNVIDFSSNPTVSSSFSLPVTLRNDSYLSGSMTIYFYWKVISNQSLSFDIKIDESMKNGDKSIPWRVVVQRGAGSSSILETGGTTSLTNFASYKLPTGKLGDVGARSITIYMGNETIYMGNETITVGSGDNAETFIGIDLDKTDVYIGTYTGNITVTVNVE